FVPFWVCLRHAFGAGKVRVIPNCWTLERYTFRAELYVLERSPGTSLLGVERVSEPEHQTCSEKQRGGTMYTNRLRKSQYRGQLEMPVRLRSARVVLLAVMLTTLLVCSPAFSQVNFGRILGSVTDPSGSAVAGATVTVTNVGTNVSRTLIADSAGAYVAAALVPGTYTVRAEAKGFRTVEHQGVLVEVGTDVRVDVALAIGATTQTVTVTEAVPLVDLNSATLGGTLSNEAINDLPLNGRNFQNLITLRPGVIIQPGGGAWTQSTNGLRAGATIYYVDGLMDNDYNVGWTVVNAPTPITEAGSILPIDAIQ